MSSNGKKGLYITLAIVIPLVCLGYAIPIYYYQVATPEDERLRNCIYDVDSDLNKAEVVKARELEFNDEMARLRVQLSSLRTLLPEELHCEEYINELSLIAKLVNTSFENSRCEISSMMEDITIGEFAFTLKDKDKEDAFLEQFSNIDRFSQLTRSTDGYQVSIYAVTRLRFHGEDKNCSPEGRKVYWPFNRKIRDLRKELKHKQETLKRLEPYVEKVRIIEGMRNQIAMLNNALQSLRNDRGE